MPKTANKVGKVNEIARELFVYVFILFLLALTSANINSYIKPKKIQVLAAETENNGGLFWNDFLTKNPDYIPGWIEIGRLDKAKEIDPNYPTP